MSLRERALVGLDGERGLMRSRMSRASSARRMDSSFEVVIDLAMAAR